MASHSATQDKSHEVFVDKTKDVAGIEHNNYEKTEGNQNLDEGEDETVTLKTWLVVFVSCVFFVNDTCPDLGIDSIHGLRTLLLAHPGHR
jgi:hypothetical protein